MFGHFCWHFTLASQTRRSTPCWQVTDDFGCSSWNSRDNTWKTKVSPHSRRDAHYNTSIIIIVHLYSGSSLLQLWHAVKYHRINTHIGRPLKARVLQCQNEQIGHLWNSNSSSECSSLNINEPGIFERVGARW